MTDYQLLIGDCCKSLQGLPETSVHCCVTSPPYYGLRDYGHDGQIGLEASPEAYIDALVAVFREVWRVLRDDGTLWVNLGDSYAARGRSGLNVGWGERTQRYAGGGDKAEAATNRTGRSVPEGLKEKDLIGIPWRVAFALQADGWYLRQDVIWQKPNPMPESVRDRCTRSHEYLFMLTKKPRYYYDHDAVKEPAAASSVARWAQNVDAQQGSTRQPGKRNGAMKAVGGPRQARDTIRRESSKRVEVMPGQRAGSHRPDRLADSWDVSMRNRRSVWNVSTRPYKGAHFATFPPALIEPCILAGCPAGGTVLDPFGGSGTTAGVALKHERHAILCEINPEYAQLVQQRVTSIVGVTADRRDQTMDMFDDTPRQEVRS